MADLYICSLHDADDPHTYPDADAYLRHLQIAHPELDDEDDDDD